MATDYYELLGVSKTSNQDEIKKAFRKQAAALHPDNQETGNEAKFKELVAAYEVLSDDEKRAVYDKYGPDGLKRGAAGGGGYTTDFDMSSFADLGEIFDYLFGGGQRAGRGRGGPSRGNDLRYDMELDFLDACHGVERKITVKHLRPCEKCSGSGAAPGCTPTICTGCGGHGQVRQTTATLFGHFSQIMSCPTCQGEGTRVEKACEECKGNGLVRKQRSLELKIPAGVDNGSRIRVSGEGDSGKKGAAPGDLYVVCHVREHESFMREGTDIHLKQTLSPSMAALGGEILVDTVNGKRLLKVPAGVQTGTVVTLKGEGVPHVAHPEKKGDQFVHYFVEVPVKLSEEEKELFKKLAELRGESLTVPESERPGETREQKQEKEHHSFFDAIAGVFKGKGHHD